MNRAPRDTGWNTGPSISLRFSQGERRGALLTLLLVASAAFGAYAPQQAGSEPLEAAQESRVQRLGKELRCAVCQGLSIADSPAGMARAQLDAVRAQVAKGATDEEIRAYFVARYGEWVLLSPPKHGLNWLVWLGPVLLIVFGGAAVAHVIYWSGRRSKGGMEGPAGPSSQPADPYLAAIRDEVDR
jgi:cytochrome c-type biogenesis protein CcmH